MRVLLTGATGFIGRQILRCLLERGHTARVVVRRPAVFDGLEGVEAVSGDFTTDHVPSVWCTRLEGIDAVVNAVGIIRERGSCTFEAVQRAAPIALFDACVEAGVKRVVQISAMGARVDHPQPFLATKAVADEHLLSLSLDASVIRPSLVVGADGESARLFRGLAALPIVPIPGDGAFPFTPVHVDDVANAVCVALEADEMPKGAHDVGGAQRVTLKEMLLSIRAWLGERPTGPTISIPLALMKLPALFGDLTGVGPIDSAQLSMLADGSACDPEPFEAAFGFRPRGLDELLAEQPATESERWHARLAQLRVPIRLLIATIWLITPTVSLAQWELGLELQLRSGVPEALAPLLLISSCALEYLIAIPLLIGRWVRAAGWAQIALMLFFTVFLSVTQTELWLDPFGPLSKNLPLIAATLAMIALEDRG